MISSLFLIKAIITVTIVVVMSLIAENISPRVVGILSGFPLGSAIILYFLGLEISPGFAAESAIYDMIGVVALLFFVYFYYKSSLFFKKYGIIFSPILAIIGFFIVIWFLHFIKVNRFVAALIPIAAIFLFIYLFRKIKNIKIENKIKFDHKILFVRALFAALVIIFVTGVAKLVGPTWAGLFSSFPKTVFPLILIVHFTYGAKYVHPIIKNLPLGLGSVLLYDLTLSFVYPIYGINIGTIISLVAAVTYLLIFWFIKNRIKK